MEEAELGFWMGMGMGMVEGSGRGSSEMSRVGWAAPWNWVVVPGHPLVGGGRLGLSAREMVLGLGPRAKWCWAFGGRDCAGPWSAGEIVLGLGRRVKLCWAMASFLPLPLGKKERKKEETEFVSAWLPGGGDLGGS